LSLMTLISSLKKTENLKISSGILEVMQEVYAKNYNEITKGSSCILFASNQNDEYIKAKFHRKSILEKSVNLTHLFEITACSKCEKWNGGII
jgi:hypothetical protein